jgi:hypothetical protein
VTVIGSLLPQNLQPKQDKTRSKTDKVDVAVGTEDIYQSVDSGIEQLSASLTYHYKQNQEGPVSGEEEGEEGPVVLTIQLPKDWLNNKSTVSVESHLKKHNGISSHEAVPSSNKSASHANIPTGSTSKSQTQLEKIQTCHTRSNTMRVQLNPRWVSTPNIVQPSKCYEPSSQKYSKKKLLHRVPPRESWAGGNVGEQHVDKTDSEVSSSFDKDSECSFISNTDSYSSLRDESVEYVKLVRLVNKPMTFQARIFLMSND